MLYISFICIAYILGIIWGLYLTKVGFSPIFLLIIFAIFFYSSDLLKSKFSIKKLLFLLLFVFIGFINSQYNIQKYENKYTNKEKVVFSGCIDQLISKGDYYNKYQFINEYNEKYLIYIVNKEKVSEGDLVSISGTFNKPSHARNTGAFDYANYLYSQGTYGSIYVSKIEITGKSNNLIYKIRDSIFNVLGKLLPNNEFGTALGMIIGNKLYIPEDISDAFKDSGISHLLAVSGNNVAFIILMTKFIFDKLFGKSASNYMCIFTIALFMLITGCSLSVIRAGLMAIIVIFSNLLFKREDTMSAISLSALIILAINPIFICDVGFILSYGGTLGVVLLNLPIKEMLVTKLKFIKSSKLLTFIIEVLSVTLSAQIILFPIMIYYFNTISVVSLLTNLLVSPFVGFITILGFVTYLTGLVSLEIARFLSFPLSIILQIVIFISKFCSSVPYANLNVPTISILSIIIYYLIVRYFFKKNLILKYVIVFLVVVQVIIIIIPNDFVKVSMIDVGQGDSILITTRNKKQVLIDGGGSEGSAYDVGENVLVPYLLDNTYGTIDAIFITHFHEDHAEGIISVLNTLNVKKVFIGVQTSENYLFDTVLKLCKEKKIDIVTIYSKDKIIIDGVTFNILYPNKNPDIQNDLNNTSLIMRVEIEQNSILFTGDAEETEENALIEYYKNDLDVLDVDILKVGHHGSKTSSSTEFLKVTTPNICIISCGVDNRFKHPHESTLKKLQEYTNSIYRTDKNGEITLKVYKNNKILVEKNIFELLVAFLLSLVYIISRYSLRVLILF